MIENFFNKLLGKRPTRILFEDIGNFSLLKEDNMKTIKIIDLLNKIANGEEVPEIIKFDNRIWNINYGEKNIYYTNDCNDDLFIVIFRKNLTFTLNDKVEILEEEKKIFEKLDISNFPKHNNSLKKTAIKLNQVIDYLKNKGE